MTARPFSQQILRLTGAGTEPDPAVYCPIHGFPDPYPPFVPDPEWPVVEIPTNNQIILLCSDEGSKQLGIKCTITSAGQYNVKVYGNADVLLSNTNTNNNVIFTYAFTSGSGYPASGYTTFKVVITPTNPTYNILTFKLDAVSGYTLNWAVYMAKFNTPAITSLASAFTGNKYIFNCEFYSNMNSLTTMNSIFYGCQVFTGVTFPDQMNLLSTLYMAFYNTIIDRLELPYLPAISNMSYMCQGTPIREFTFQSNMATLTEVYGTFYNCFLLKKCTLWTNSPLLAHIGGLFDGCNLLTGSFLFPPMPLLITTARSFSNCRLVTGIAFTGPSNLAYDWNNHCIGCTELRYFIFPSSINTNSNINMSQMLANCGNKLNSITLPITMTGTGATNVSNLLSGTNFLKTLSKCDSWQVGLINFQTGGSMVDLDVFDQPTLRVSCIRLVGTSATIRGKLTDVTIDWENSIISIDIQLMYLQISNANLYNIINRLPSIQAVGFQSFSCSYNAEYTIYLSVSIVTTINSKIIGVTNTSALLIGMEVQAPNISVSSTRPCTIQDAGNTITRIEHGFPSGKQFSFDTLVTTTGVTRRTVYFVVNPTADTFQVSLSENGSALELTNDGTCTIIIVGKIVAITPNMNITIDIPCVASAGGNGYFSTFERSRGYLKGYSIG